MKNAAKSIRMLQVKILPIHFDSDFIYLFTFFRHFPLSLSFSNSPFQIQTQNHIYIYYLRASFSGFLSPFSIISRHFLLLKIHLFQSFTGNSYFIFTHAKRESDKSLAVFAEPYTRSCDNSRFFEEKHCEIN